MADENINNALNNINQAGGAAQQLAEMLQAASRSSARQTTATDVARDSMREFDRAQNGVRNGMMGMVSTLSHMASSLVSVGSSAYTADKAFTAMIPTLDAMGAALKGTFDALGKAGSGISAFGFSLGQSTEGISKAAQLYVEVLQGALKFQLESAQQVADRFVELSNAGAIFAGGITELKGALHGIKNEAGEIIKEGLGLPLQEFTRIVSQNVESIAALGVGMKAGSGFVAGMGKKIFYANDGLAALYGNVESLSKGTADYLALQTQLGIDTTENFEISKAGATEYLMRQKELAAITGKTAETMKREEEGRRKQIDYNLKLGRLGDDARENVREGMQLAGKIFGDSGAKYAEEYFATGGNVYTKEALTYQAMNQEAAQAIEGMLSGIDQSRKAFRDNATKTFQDAAPELAKYATEMEEYASINRAANNSVIKGMTDTATAIQNALPFIENMGTVFAEMDANREELKNANLDKSLGTIVDANKMMLANRMEVDAVVIENMSKMKDLVKALYETQLAFIKAQPDAIEAFNKIKTSGNNANLVLQEFANRLADRMGFTLPPPPENGSTPASGSNRTPSGIPGLNAGDIAPRPNPLSGQNPQIQPEPETRTSGTDRRSQAPVDKELMAALSALPSKSDAERMNRDVVEALQRLHNAVA